MGKILRARQLSKQVCAVAAKAVEDKENTEWLVLDKKGKVPMTGRMASSCFVQSSEPGFVLLLQKLLFLVGCVLKTLSSCAEGLETSSRRTRFL